MFKIARRAARQILNNTKRIKDLAVSSMTAKPKYLKPSEEQGYMEDARDEFVFIRVLPDYAEAGAKYSICDLREEVQPIDWLGIEQTTDTRFAEKIISKAIKDFLVVKNIVDEFKEFKSQGYDFEVTKKAIQNQNVKNLSHRMQELSISGYLSNYAGEPSLREDIEKVSIQKELVINEFMERVTGKIEELEEYSSELLG